jgi:hypothetical protein
MPFSIKFIRVTCIVILPYPGFIRIILVFHVLEVRNSGYRQHYRYVPSGVKFRKQYEREVALRMNVPSEVKVTSNTPFPRRDWLIRAMPPLILG